MKDTEMNDFWNHTKKSTEMQTPYCHLGILQYSAFAPCHSASVGGTEVISGVLSFLLYCTELEPAPTIAKLQW
jgi:hypothetical protein